MRLNRADFGNSIVENTNVTAMEARLSLNKINTELGNSRLKLSDCKVNNAEVIQLDSVIATNYVQQNNGSGTSAPECKRC